MPLCSTCGRHWFWRENKAYREASERIPDWIDLSLDQLRQHDDAQKFFNNTPSMNFDLISFAARKEYCEWDLPLREYNVETRIPGTCNGCANLPG